MLTLKIMKPCLQRQSTEFVVGIQQKQITSFKEFHNKHDNNPYFIGVIRERGQQTFRTALINDDQIYISQQVTFQDIRNPSYSINNNPNQFRNDILSALAIPGKNSKYFIKVVNKTSNHKEIHIFKTTTTLKVKIAEINVFKNANESKNRTYFYKKLESTLILMQNEKQNLSKQNKELQKDYNKSHKMVQESIKMREEIESELMNKFVLILNAKKAKIRKLQQEIEKLKKSKTNRDLTKNHDKKHKNNDKRKQQNKIKMKENEKDKSKRKSVEKDDENKSNEFSFTFSESIASITHIIKQKDINHNVSENEENDANSENARNTTSALSLYLNSENSMNSEPESQHNPFQNQMDEAIFNALQTQNIDNNQEPQSNKMEIDEIIGNDGIEKDKNIKQTSTPRTPKTRTAIPPNSAKSNEDMDIDLSIGSNLEQTQIESGNDTFMELQSQIQATIYDDDNNDNQDTNSNVAATVPLSVLSFTEQYNDTEYMTQNPKKKRKLSDLLSFPT